MDVAGRHLLAEDYEGVEAAVFTSQAEVGQKIELPATALWSRSAPAFGFGRGSELPPIAQEDARPISIQVKGAAPDRAIHFRRDRGE